MASTTAATPTTTTALKTAGVDATIAKISSLDDQASTAVSSLTPEQLQQLLFQLLPQQSNKQQCEEGEEEQLERHCLTTEESSPFECRRLVIAEEEELEEQKSAAGDGNLQWQQSNAMEIDKITTQAIDPLHQHSIGPGTSSHFHFATAAALPTTITPRPNPNETKIVVKPPTRQKQPTRTRKKSDKQQKQKRRPEDGQKQQEVIEQLQQQRTSPFSTSSSYSAPTLAVKSDNNNNFSQQLAELFSAGLQHLLIIGATTLNSPDIPNPLANISVEDLGRMVMEQMCKEIGDQAQQYLADLAELAPGLTPDELLNGAALAMATQLGLVNGGASTLSQQQPTQMDATSGHFWHAIQMGMMQAMAATATTTNPPMLAAPMQMVNQEDGGNSSKDDSGIVADYQHQSQQFMEEAPMLMMFPANGQTEFPTMFPTGLPVCTEATTNSDLLMNQPMLLPMLLAISQQQQNQQQFQTLAECFSMAAAAAANNNNNADAMEAPSLEQQTEMLATLFQQQQNALLVPTVPSSSSSFPTSVNQSSGNIIDNNKTKKRNSDQQQKQQQNQALSQVVTSSAFNNNTIKIGNCNQQQQRHNLPLNNKRQRTPHSQKQQHPQKNHRQQQPNPIAQNSQTIAGTVQNQSQPFSSTTNNSAIQTTQQQQQTTFQLEPQKQWEQQQQQEDQQQQQMVAVQMLSQMLMQQADPMQQQQISTALTLLMRQAAESSAITGGQTTPTNASSENSVSANPEVFSIEQRQQLFQQLAGASAEQQQFVPFGTSILPLPINFSTQIATEQQKQEQRSHQQQQQTSVPVFSIAPTYPANSMFLPTDLRQSENLMLMKSTAEINEGKLLEMNEEESAKKGATMMQNENNINGFGFDSIEASILPTGSFFSKSESPETGDEQQQGVDGITGTQVTAHANRRKKPREGRSRVGSQGAAGMQTNKGEDAAVPQVVVTTVPGTGALTAKSEKSLGALLRQHPEGAERAEELEELEDFANFFKKQRIKHGFTQGDVGVALGKRYGTDFSQTTISRFEALNLSFKNMCKLRPLLQDWLGETGRLLGAGATVQDIMEGVALQRAMTVQAQQGTENHNNGIPSEQFQLHPQSQQNQTDQNGNEGSIINGEQQQHPQPVTTTMTTIQQQQQSSLIPPFKKRRKRTNLDTAQKGALDSYFCVDSRPDNARMNEIASLLDLEQDVVRVWFCNRRQKLRKN